MQVQFWAHVIGDDFGAEFEGAEAGLGVVDGLGVRRRKIVSG
jgi:hypothetical protein